MTARPQIRRRSRRGGGRNRRQSRGPVRLGDANDPPKLSLAKLQEMWAEDIALADGTAVETWPARVGVDLTQGTVAQRPTFQKSDSNFSGHASVLFDGADDNIGAGYGQTFSQVVSYFWVCRLVSIPAGANSQIWDNNDGTTNRHYFLYQNTTIDKLKFAAITQLSGNAAWSGLETRAFSAVADDTSSYWEYNGANRTSGAAGTDATDGLRLGGRYDGTANNINVEIAYWLMCQGTFTAADLAVLEDWAGDLYGITMS